MKFIFPLLVMLFLVIPLFAQTAGEIDWASLGVDVVIVGVIITVIQVLKKLIVLPSWTYVALAMLLSAIYAVITHLSSGIEVILKLAFAYASAAGYLFDAGKTILSKKPE